MTKIVLVRPGSTDYDHQQRIQGNLDVPLNRQGSVEVAKLIEELGGLPIEAVYSPSCEPAHQTAKTLAAALHLKCRKLDQMKNLNHGLWQGMRIDEVRRKYPRVYRQWQEQPQSVQPPEGETVDQAIHRIQTAMAKLLKKHKEGMIALVLPEPIASLVRQHLDHGELGDLWKASLGHGRWELCDVPSSVTA
ncbi:MAG: histidine phosphatase family protein [Pirellulaceae bacterium]|nr:histidine phosphatase family protein [Pirellulaceae bacterium]